MHANYCIAAIVAVILTLFLVGKSCSISVIGRFLKLEMEVSVRL